MKNIFAINSENGTKRENITNVPEWIAEEAVAMYDDEALKKIERRELSERIQGMSQEELEIVVENIPIEMCLARISKELERANRFMESIKGAFEQ